MKLLDRYILKQMLTTFIFVVLILLAVITVIDLTEKTDKYSKANLSAWQILGYYGDFLPWIAGLVTPITVFIATVYITARLAGRTEIIAMLSSGMSFRRMMLPYFIGAVLIAGTSFWLNGWVIPNSNKTRLAFEIEYLNKSSNPNLRNIHLQVSPNTFIYIQNYNSVSDVGYQFSIEKFDDNRLVEKLTANRIEWDTAKSKWTLRDWKIRKVDNVFEKVRRDSVGETVTSGLAMDTLLVIEPKEFKNDYRKYDGLTIDELKEYISTLRFRGSAGIEAYEVELYTRYASPFSIFILTFMGVIVSSRKSRGGTGLQIAIGFALSFIFILFVIMFRSFAESGAMPPAISVWIPTLVFGIISAFMYKYVPR
ncbi:MAG: LptF/LptG family permease [Cyclobacteriaceae bacterium]|nr:MAG: LptF/LptG family permease [Cyclobacteriaceae bacterium]